MTALVEQGLEFNEVDRDRFLEMVQDVYRDNAERVGGMDAIREVQEH